jgi:hypothetical protein
MQNQLALILELKDLSYVPGPGGKKKWTINAEAKRGMRDAPLVILQGHVIKTRYGAIGKTERQVLNGLPAAN